MISYQEAKRIILAEANKKDLAVESVKLQEAIGRYLSGDIKAPLSIQPFDNSAMDGFAICSKEARAVSKESPILLTIRGIIAAGSSAEIAPLAAGDCYKIMTGAPVPSGADAVIPIEEACIENDRLCIKEPVEAGKHIRKAGADIQAGSLLLQAGDRIYVSDILPLASLGVASLEVRCRPAFSFISTGDEIVDDLSAPLKNGEIYNANQAYAVAYLESLGAVCRRKVSLKDQPSQFKDLLQKIMEEDKVDIVISSGAVSAGDFDFIKQGLEESGAQILFHKVKIKPGKPVLFAILPNGALYFGLPGNPAATAAGLRFFVTPAILSLMKANEELPFLMALGEPINKTNELRLFLKAILSPEGGEVKVTDGQESFRVQPFFSMNSWLVLKESCGQFEKGTLVECYPESPDSRMVRR